MAAAAKKEELAEQRRLQEEEHRIKEDKIIEQIEKEFWANNTAMKDGTRRATEDFENPSSPGLQLSLDNLISDAELDRLLAYVEAGNDCTLEPRQTPEISSGLPSVDEETMKKAQQIVDVLTASLAESDRRAAEKKDDREQRVKEEQQRMKNGEDCEMARLFAKELRVANKDKFESATCFTLGPAIVSDKKVDRSPVVEAIDVKEEKKTVAPEFEVVQENDAASGKRKVVVRVKLPLCEDAENLDASIVEGNMLELEVPGLYWLRIALPITIDEDGMVCKYDKKKRTLKLTLPSLS